MQICRKTSMIWILRDYKITSISGDLEIFELTLSYLQLFGSKFMLWILECIGVLDIPASKIRLYRHFTHWIQFW